VGFDHGERLEIPGAGAALPIFARFLEEAVGPSGVSGPWGSDGFSVPPGLERARVSVDPGLEGPWRCSAEPELFLRGTVPESRCWGRWWDRRSLEQLLERRGSEGRRLLLRLLERIGVHGDSPGSVRR
jgi:hypothetical protein